eukprot:TRINITY_DN3572_c0_g1_i2.p1 TRINITY_DN3572_c0_g1~~TRINITY_DN3572_c0_g1_i2.p1  ORF type:complete len:229 (-),score=78.59 TRINITY_DN3572_c0_g1_i2:128-814(-)
MCIRDRYQRRVRGRERVSTMPDNKKKRKAEQDQSDNLKKLKDFVTEKELKIREETFSTILNDKLLISITACQALADKAYTFKSYAEMRDAGFIVEVRDELQESFRIATKLEAWLNTYQPPLSCGGSAAVSSEVQDGIFGSMHSLSSECSEALMRMFALEKDRAVMREKMSDEEVWLRYECYLDSNQMHDVRKTTQGMASNMMSVSNVIANNFSHLTSWSEQEHQGLMY